MESLDFRDQTTLIAGVSADLIEVYRPLGAKAGKIALLSRNPKKIEQFTARLKEWEIETTGFVGDVTDSNAVLNIFRELTLWSRRLDFFIYNVGVVSNESASKVTESELSRVMSANFFGFVNCFQLALPVMKQTRGGHVIVISGSGALDPEHESVAYAASKSSMQIYTKALRRELADRSIVITELYLGRMQSGSGWRWLTCEEIVAGIRHVLLVKPERHLVGEI